VSQLGGCDDIELLRKVVVVVVVVVVVKRCILI
jgi:hypothetical protein